MHGGGNAECQRQNETCRDEVATIERESSDEAGEQATEVWGVHTAGMMGDYPYGVVRNEKEGCRPEQRG